MRFYKYHGAGNDFIIADNRNNTYLLDNKTIAKLCDRHIGIGADGLILLNNKKGYDFEMLYYNADGSSDMMCGNGGRCLVGFAIDMKIVNADNIIHFYCAGKDYSAELMRSKEGKEANIRLKMQDINNYGKISQEEYFLNTGTYHFVKFVKDIEKIDVITEGRKIRYDKQYYPNGTNVNFVEKTDNKLIIRTYEKGVEDETLACGTGIVAAALAYYAHNYNSQHKKEEKIKISIRAKIAELEVEFTASYNEGLLSAKDIYLIGPYSFVASIDIDIK